MYYSKSIKDRIECKISEVSATDHVPVITSYKIGKSRAKIYSKNITKRCLKNFSESSWNQCLATKNWSSFEVSSDLNEMFKTFEDTIKEALDEIAPIMT